MKHYLASSQFKVVLCRSYETDRQVVFEKLIFICLNGDGDVNSQIFRERLSNPARVLTNQIGCFTLVIEL